MDIRSSHFSKLALTTALCTSLILAGCGNKDKDNAAQNFSIEKIAPRSVDQAEALQALTTMCLNETGAGVLSWAARTGEAGNYVFNDVTINPAKDDIIRVGTVEMLGAHMDGGQARFDSIVFTDINMTDKEGAGTIKAFELIKPSADLANELARALCAQEDAFDNVSGDFGFGGAVLSGLSFQDDNSNMQLESLKFGTADDDTGVLALKGLNLTIKDKDTVKFSIGSIDANGINLEKYKTLIELSMQDDKDAASGDVLQALTEALNPYDPDYKNASITDLHADISGFIINMDAMSASASTKNGTIVMVQDMSPLTLTPPAQSDNKDITEMIEAMATLGYEELVFTMKQTSVLDAAADSMKITNSYLALKDGFKLSYDYDIVGYDAFTKKMSDSPQTNNPLAALSSLEDIKLGSLRLAFKDQSIVDRAFKFAAKQQGSEPEALKAQAKLGLGFLSLMAQDAEQQRLATDLATALTKLMDDGGTFIIEADPDTPFAIAGLANAGDLDVAALGLSIRTE